MRYRGASFLYFDESPSFSVFFFTMRLFFERKSQIKQTVALMFLFKMWKYFVSLVKALLKYCYIHKIVFLRSLN